MRDKYILTAESATEGHPDEGTEILSNPSGRFVLGGLEEAKKFLNPPRRKRKRPGWER